MRGVWVLCALALWLCEVGAQKPPVVAGTAGKKFTKEELQLLASSGKFASKPRLAPPESHKFQLEQKSEPLTRKEFIKKFGPRIRDSPTTMDPDQIFLALDTNRDSLVEKEELKGFRTLVPPPQMNFKKFQLQFGKRLTHVADLEATFANMDVDGDGTLNPREQSAITKLLHAGKEL